MLFYKFFGFVLIIGATSFFGFFKASSLKKRSQKLESIAISLSKMSQMIRNQTGELKELLLLSFEKDCLFYNGNVPEINKLFLENSDIELLQKFLNETGMGDSETEFKRICVYKTLFENRTSSARKRENELYKLYNSLGFLMGLAICIFLV